MPFKSKRKGSKRQIAKQQSKLLKTRLIRISMVIDNYLYKQKPIPIKDARAYVEEVSKYKLQCENDARSLQVIEKITRCMNAIITEQQENGASSNNFKTPCPSPVYSLPEEDKTMFSEALQPNIETKEMTNHIEAIEARDVCDDYSNNVEGNINYEVEVEIHRAMSNLSIRANENTQMLEETYSQSTLDNCSANVATEIVGPNKNPIPLLSGDSFTIRNNFTDTIDCSQSILSDFDKNVSKPVHINTITANNPSIDKSYKAPINIEELKKNNVSPTFNTSIKNIEIKNVQFNENVEVIDLTKLGTKIKKPSQRGNKNKDSTQRKKSLAENPVKVGKRRKSQKNDKIPNFSEASTPKVALATNNVTNNNFNALQFYKTKANTDEDFNKEMQTAYISTINNSNIL